MDEILHETPEISLKNVTVNSGEYTVLHDISAIIKQNIVTVISGNAGSGKSTCIKTAAGLVIPEFGDVYYRGLNLAKMKVKEELDFRKNTGFVFQDSALWANQSIYNNIILPLRLHYPTLKKLEIDNIVRNMLEIVGYDESVNVRPAELSSGEQKMMGIVRAFIHNPRFVFMDEPTANLDDSSCERIYKLILDKKKEGIGMAIVTHSTELIELVADELIVLKAGTIWKTGSYDDLSSSQDGETRKAIGRIKPRRK